MAKLRPVEEVWDIDLVYMGKLTFFEVLQADREAIVQACAMKASKKVQELTGDRIDGRQYGAIIAVAKPRESERERLGRVLFESMCENDIDWECLSESAKETRRLAAAAVLAEQAKMQEESTP